MILSLWELSRSRRALPSPSYIKELFRFASRRPQFRWRTYWLENLIPNTKNTPLGAEWIEFFDWLGRENAVILIDSPRQEIAEQLIYHFSADPERRRGLLRIIAELAKAGCQCQIPANALSLAKTWDQRSKDDAIGLSFGRAGLTDDEIKTLATEILMSSASDVVAWRALRIASVPSITQSAKLALALLSELRDASESESDAADHARRVISEFLANRPSLLQDPQIWKRLNMPEQL